MVQCSETSVRNNTFVVPYHEVKKVFVFHAGNEFVIGIRETHSDCFNLICFAVHLSRYSANALSGFGFTTTDSDDNNYATPTDVMRAGDHVYEVTTTSEASNPALAAAPVYATGNAFSTPIVSMAVRDVPPTTSLGGGLRSTHGSKLA